MNKDSLLHSKVCYPCQNITKPIENKEALELLSKLGKKWIINQKGYLYKKFYFKNFIEAMNFANKIAAIAEKEGHHPDMAISWGKCEVSIWTHKINGLTESDFILGAKIEELKYNTISHN
jgi:4a-hydroxytetrahydrobiopterin dehydratase